MDMLPAISECRKVGLKDASTKVMLDKQPHCFSDGFKITDPDRNEVVDVTGVEAQLKRDASDDNRFHLFLGGIRVFQWLRQQWQRVRNIFRPPTPPLRRGMIH